MKKIDLGQTISVLANLGVIGGLVFVGLQIQQDREIAVVARIQSLESNFYNWAELVNANNSLWARGLAGEELSPYEMVQFSSLAEARQFALWSRWFASGSAVASGVVAQDSFMQESAREIASNPGFLSWWLNFYQRSIELGRADEYDESLNAKINALLATGNAK